MASETKKENAEGEKKSQDISETKTVPADDGTTAVPAEKNDSEKVRKKALKEKRREYKCEKCDQVLGTPTSRNRHQAACKLVVMEVDASSDEDLDDIDADEDYVEGKSRNSGLKGIIHMEEGSTQALRRKFSIKNKKAKLLLKAAKARKLKSKKVEKDGKLKSKKVKNADVPKKENLENQKPQKKKKLPKKKKPVEGAEGAANECTKCELKFPDPEALGVHMENHSPPSPKMHQCFVCKMQFSRKYHLDRHVLMTRCSGQPPPAWPCQVCAKVYTRKDNLREHLRAHAGEVSRRRKYKCEHCQKQFHGVSLLNIHIRTHTGEKPFKCDYCDKAFPSAGAMAKHRRIHTGEKPYSCGDCGLKFTLKGTLNRHMRIHTGVRPHKCKFCGKEFIQIGGLTAHMFYHTGENAFRCEDCGKNFNRKARLQMHIRYVHEKFKPFDCRQCSKSFTRKEDLIRHQILHTGEKPHQCPTCTKTFAIKPSLKMHLLTHTKEEPRSCHECGRAFIRKDCLLRHMRKRHRDLLDKILHDEGDQKQTSSNNDGTSPTTAGPSPHVFNENNISESIRELLSLLVDEPTLKGFGWPYKPVDELLEAVIRRCGHTPVSPDDLSYMDRLRENSKLLFTVVIDDNAVKTLLNNQTVDEVILHVLRLAKS